MQRIPGRSNIHQSTSEDDDLYAFPAAEDLTLPFGDEPYRRGTALTTRGATPSTRLGTAAGFKRETTGIWTRGGVGTAARPVTGADGGLNRPMTAVRGAGYTRGGGRIDPLSATKKTTPISEPKPEETTDEKVRILEEKINNAIEQSVLAGCRGDHRKGLELAKDAANKEKVLMKTKEAAGTGEGHDWDLTFSVLFNLALQYEGAEMWTEALTTYNAIAKNKLLLHGPKVKINMGNIHFKMGHPTKAVKMYRMAMDQLSTSNKDLRLKLMHNMGIIFLQMDHPSDAAASFEYIMQEKPSFKTGLHFVVASFMTGDVERMKRAFQDLLQIPAEFGDEDDDKYAPHSDDDPVAQLLMEVLRNDKLRKFEKERKLYAERCVLSSARLIAPVIESSLAEGYHWVTEEIRGSRHISLAHALEISKAIVFLKQGELSEAAEILKSFEKKETKVATAAATNLSFVFFLKGDLNLAQKYGEMATKADFYNSVAYVNLGNCHFLRGDWEEAKRCYTEAIGIDSSCVEALYNLGLVNQHLRFYEEALECFHKIQSLVRNHPHISYQLGRTHELRGEVEVANEWFLKALALVPTDPGLLKKLGELADIEGDRQQAYQHYYDCHKYDPSDLSVIEWVATYLQEMQLPEKALNFLSKAQLLQPEEPKWSVSIGHAYRRMGNYSQALETFRKVHKEYPDHVQALSSLVRLATDMGLKEADHYKEELGRLERAQEIRRSAPTPRFGAPSRMGSSRSAQRQPQHQMSSNSSLDDRSSDVNSEYGYPIDSRRGSGGDRGDQALFDEEDDLIDFPVQQTKRPETSRGGAARPKTAAMEDINAFFAANEVGSDVLPI